MKHNFIKKGFIVRTMIKSLLVALILVLVVGCGGGSNSAKSENNQINLVANGDKPKEAIKVKEFSGETSKVKINLLSFLNRNKRIQKRSISGDFVSRETEDFSRVTAITASVWYNNEIYEEMDIPFSEEFSLELPNAENVEFYISLRDLNGKELFFGNTIYSGHPEKLELELQYNTWRESQMYIYTEDFIELPFDVSDINKSNAVIYFADGYKIDAVASEGEGDKTGFKISPIWKNKDGSLEIDNHWNLKNLPVKVVLLDIKKEIYLDPDLKNFAIDKETLVEEIVKDIEVSLVDSRLKDFKEGVIYTGEQNNISLVTDQVYYLICTPSEKKPMEDPLLNVNGSEYDDSETMYPEPVLLEKGLQNISVKNLSDIGEGFELKIISEEEYISKYLLKEEEVDKCPKGGCEDSIDLDDLLEKLK